LREDEVEYLPSSVDDNSSDLVDDDTTIVIPFQNENLCAYMEKKDGTRTVNPFFIFYDRFSEFSFLKSARCYR
jgi:hypothetical protein